MAPHAKKESLHASWKGLVRIDLITFPVLAFNALDPEAGDVHLRQLHEVCNSKDSTSCKSKTA